MSRFNPTRHFAEPPFEGERLRQYEAERRKNTILCDDGVVRFAAPLHDTEMHLCAHLPDIAIAGPLVDQVHMWIIMRPVLNTIIGRLVDEPILHWSGTMTDNVARRV